MEKYHTCKCRSASSTDTVIAASAGFRAPVERAGSGAIEGAAVDSLKGTPALLVSADPDANNDAAAFSRPPQEEDIFDFARRSCENAQISPTIFIKD